MTIIVTYTFCCAACDACREEQWTLVQPGPLIVPTLPKEWREMGRLVYCPNHRIEVIVDGDSVGLLSAYTEGGSR
jgi:hypothetical protein